MSPPENQAAWLYGVDDLRILPFTLPDLGAKDVRVRVKAVGICGSDVHYLKKMECAGFVVESPMVIGHESAGIVSEVGTSVKHLKVGDRVAMEPGIACNTCTACKEGRYNLCEEMKFFATPPVHGSLANEVIHPADLCFKLPDSVSLEDGAMCEPLSVAVHACRRAEIAPGKSIAVMGAGPIGLVSLLVAKAFGASKIAVTDVDDSRLAMAKQLGAHAVVKVSNKMEDVEAEAEKLRSVLGGKVDVTLDCAGFTKTMQTALAATKSGGRVCLVGMGHTEMTLPLTPAAAREVDVVGVFRYRNTYPLCIELLESKLVDVKPLITHRFGFSDADVKKAFDTSAKGGEAIKVMFNL
ncbi:Sorbitol dehydrogenase [Klebsormidium nitens]|uniref:Sorbitol dehydrogenase n=1 Tax=Klebsormidium nitens TaxID=105231 RepID=A0A1Y1HSP0_KLENI|nr:Sorbitol dehydrogenase [Klebsormidium nitens]|eukprot:GAQ80199.1 Sorbitol dehydrogenase [Klebsormidium nitens]